MKKTYLLILLFIFELCAYSQVIKGNLSVDTTRTDQAIVGESYSAVLTLFPIEEGSVERELFENKIILESFYVSRVLDMRASENNSDALMVFLEVVLTKNIKSNKKKTLLINSIEALITVDIGEIEETELIIKKFITFETKLEKEAWFYWMVGSILIVVALFGMASYYLIKRKLKNSGKTKVNFYKELSAGEKHQDFEWIYRNRKILRDSIESNEKAMLKFNELTSKIENYQYKQDWRNMDISEFVSMRNKILELCKDGI